MRITDLKVNNLVFPVGIDTVPTFRWINDMPGYGRAQSAYRITVASTAKKAEAQEGDLWDSGKVENTLNYDISYGGATLSSCTRYFFTVQVWDEKGDSVRSDVSCFETGILDPAEWQGKWIGMTDGDIVPCDIDLGGAYLLRLETELEQTAGTNGYFRIPFTVDENREVDEVLAVAAMEDYGYLFINCSCVLVGKKEDKAEKSCKVLNITPYVEKGGNIFAARIVSADKKGGFAAKIEVRYTDGSVESIVTDRNTKCSVAVGSTSGWERPGYNDTEWTAASSAILYAESSLSENTVMPTDMRINVGAGAPMLRRAFEVSKNIEKARAYISGLGLYELYINGGIADDTVLTLAHTQYDDTVHYRVYDITKILTTGKNAIAVELGNYFYNCDFYTWMNWNTAAYRDDPKLLFELHIDYADGTSETIVSDESWKTYEYGPVTYNNVYKGESYDARREVKGWNRADFNDSGWKNAIAVAAPGGKLIFENMEPIRRLKTFKPKVLNKGAGRFIIVNPEMTAGWARISFNAPAGTEITITYGEKLDELGFLIPTANGYPLQVDKFITSGGSDVYEPKYSYKGYQYIQVDNYGGELSAEDVECYLIASDVASISTFGTGSSRINYMQEMMLRTIMNNLQSKLTDTPVYEKNGWTGDVNFSVESFNYNYDLSNMLPKILRDMGDTANERGAVNQIAPASTAGGNSIPIWSSIFISGYWENYRTNGVFTEIEKNYELIRLQTLDYLRVIKENGWVWTTVSYADWMSPNPSQAYTTGRTTHAPEGAAIIGSAFVYRTLGQMAEIADKLGKSGDAAEYRSARKNIYTAFNEKFYNKEKGYYDTGYWIEQYDAGRTKYRQASNIIPLMFGLCPKEYEKSVAESIVKDIKAKGDHIDVGAVGTKYILPMLSKYGYGDLAMALIKQDTYPSWGYWISLGANTCWESYESNARSRNHFFLGTYTDWFYKNLAGVRDFTNGFETVVLKPEIHPEIGYVNYSIKTVRGELASCWRFTEDNKLFWNVTVPVGTTATVYLPAKADISEYACITDNGDSLTVPSGSYVFVMDGGVFGGYKPCSEKPAFDNTVTPSAEKSNTSNALRAKGNLALGKRVYVSSEIKSNGWAKEKLTDGDRENLRGAEICGWTSNSFVQFEHSEYACVDLGEVYKVDRVQIMPAGAEKGERCVAFPKAFTILVSRDGEKWYEVYSAESYPIPTTDMQVFDFNEADARYVLFKGTSLRKKPTDGNRFRMQLAEFEVYNTRA